MYRLYKKNELSFSLVWIIAYVVSLSIADNLSASFGTLKIITAPVSIIFTLLILGFINQHNLWEQYGLCSFQGDLKKYLYFIPLILITSVNLWNGITMNTSITETALFILSMICVGVIEEIIFRGFLFKAMCKDNIKSAVFISSITFGMGHIVNLLNGKAVISTLLQICYAAAIGFLFTLIFYKGKSILPCIITHAAINSLSIFAVHNASLQSGVITAVILCIVPIAYALWILRKTKRLDKEENRDGQ
ncbi:CPBP family intramembrane glutamic endopeptidase [Holdemania massiliensis]|uniref:CPBP family intramembrane metalloprotease n=1 Tax=Holdemania massiliensis TaxID=1468449 RepID=A0A6N7S332_9FIRM|nr:CPBP family intramembrane glutamic endopeptidase [Holdemania massiliensis]MSA70389.1 CPBP family intramembrane metalloprotease [Holdemania massiliensis]MSA88080.1 CPBP family intramembrane metalloprotease [Holdemania massiliensis]MSB76909.1 CPBP family intramembrane metalloprotease [Holdemania massiliensis]MSC31835.1 CPBP family intramembrane metalloprotease [Holdemania massiliensis]MSC38155.1 CPBP family intramembrane metalloprotease [Holdemania massiliensis]